MTDEVFLLDNGRKENGGIRNEFSTLCSGTDKQR